MLVSQLLQSRELRLKFRGLALLKISHDHRLPLFCVVSSALRLQDTQTSFSDVFNLIELTSRVQNSPSCFYKNVHFGLLGRFADLLFVCG